MHISYIKLYKPQNSLYYKIQISHVVLTHRPLKSESASIRLPGWSADTASALSVSGLPELAVTSESVFSRSTHLEKKQDSHGTEKEDVEYS